MIETLRIVWTRAYTALAKNTKSQCVTNATPKISLGGQHARGERVWVCPRVCVDHGGMHRHQRILAGVEKWGLHLPRDVLRRGMQSTKHGRGGWGGCVLTRVLVCV